MLGVDSGAGWVLGSTAGAVPGRMLEDAGACLFWEELAEGAGQEREEGQLPGFVLPGDTRGSQGARTGFAS